MPSCSVGKTRSRSTGRCRKPCERHQAINPATGRCVTKNYLRKIQRESRGCSDKIYQPATCGPGMAINPRTGRCVTLRYLRTLNPDDYDTDGDDGMTSRVLFTPTDLSTKPGVIEKFDDGEIMSSEVSENDLIVMRAALGIANNILEISEFGYICGIYSSDLRRETCGAAKASTSQNLQNVQECGVRDARHLDTRADLETYISERQSMFDKVFLFVTRPASTIPEEVFHAVHEVAKKSLVRLLYANRYGVWRMLVPRVDDNDPRGESLKASMIFVLQKFKEAENSIGVLDSRQLAHEVYETLDGTNHLHMAFAPYPSSS